MAGAAGGVYNKTMKLVRVTGMMDGVGPLSERLLTELSAGKRVLWLVPGGSNIPLSVAVMDRVPEDLSGGLTLMLTDERFGPVGHPDSNTVQLDLAGLNPKSAHVIPVLRENLSRDDTVRCYAEDFSAQASDADVIIGQFGMGADGHLAGMLPGSGAVTTDELTFGYKTETFTRITLTPLAIRQLDAAYVFAFGPEKAEALSNLATKQLDLDTQPAQVVKELAEAYVYNDQEG